MAVDWSKEPPPPRPRVDWSAEPPPVVKTPDQTAYQASGTTSAQAASALDLSQKTGLAPQWVQGNYEAVKAEHELTTFRAALGARPITKQWADQSPQHAAAVREDMGPLGRIEGWFSGMGDALVQGFADIDEAEAMREHMGSGGVFAKYATGLEEDQKWYDSREHTIGEQIARAAPQVAMYGLTSYFTGGAGLAGLLYAQNKGVLARRIQEAQPGEGGALALKPGESDSDHKGLTPEEIDIYATVGSAAAAVTMAGLLTPFLRAVPGVREAMESLAGSTIGRVAATSVGRAAVRSLAAYGTHTLMGATGMALQGTINEATVEKATTGKFEPEKLAATAAHDFVHMLPVALAFGAWGPGKDFLSERGRITDALAGGAKMDDLVRMAKEVKLRQKSPPLAEQLFGLLGSGQRVFIGYKAAQKLDLPDADVARATATQGAVAVPVEKYLTRFADDHEAIREDVKLNPEGLTPREASERVKELGSMMTEAEAKALYGRMPGEGGFSYPLAGDLTREQLAKGYALKPEEIDAALGPRPGTVSGRTPPPADKTEPGSPPTQESKPLHEAMAEEYGGTPEEWQKRLTPELLGRLTSPTRVSPQAAAMADVALRQKPLGDIQPGQFELDAKRASDALTKQAMKSGDLAATRGQEQNAVKSRMKEAELTSAKETARAYADAAKAIREKYDADLGKLQKRGADGSTYRETFNKADAASGNVGYDHVYRGLIDAVSGVALPRPEALDALPNVLQRMRDWNLPVAFDEKVVTQLLARGKAWDQMLPAEADHVIEATKNLRTAALAEIKLGKQDLADAAANVSWEAAVLPKVKEALVSGNVSLWDRVVRYPAAFNARALERMEILKSLGATVKEHVVDAIYGGLEKRDQLRRTVGAKYEEAVRKLPPELAAKRFDSVEMPPEMADAYRRKGLTPNPDREFLWTTALMWGDGQARQRHLAGLGLPHDLVNNWLVDNMTPREWDLVKHVGNTENGVLWGELRAKEERKSGVAPEESQKAPIFDRAGNQIAEGWYFPLARDRRAYTTDGGPPSPGELRSPSDLFGSSYTRPAVQHRFLKERAQQAAYVIDLNWGRIPQHIDQVIHDIAFDEPVTNAAKLLLHPVVDATLKERLGMEKRDQIHAWLRVAANERAEAANGLGVLQNVWNFLRNRTQSSALGNSLPVIAAMGTHNLLSLIHGEVPRISGAFDYQKAISPSARKFALENSEVMRQRETASKVNRQDDMGLFSDRFQESKLGKGLDIAARVAQFGQDFMDTVLGTGYFTAKYNEVFEKTHDHEAASAAGNEMVRQNLQPRTPMEKSWVMNNKGPLSAVLAFHGFWNKVYNKEAVRIGGAADAWANLPEKPTKLTPADIEKMSPAEAKVALERGGVDGDSWDQRKAKEYSDARAEAAWKTAKTSGEFLALLGVLTLGKISLGYGREEGETWAQRLARGILSAGFDLIPLVSNVTEPLIAKAVSGKARPVDFRTAPVTAGLQKFIHSVQAAANENRSDQMWKAVDAGVMAAGAGSSQYVRTAKYLTGPRASRDLGQGRLGSYVHGVMYDEHNTSETFPLLIEHMIEGTK